MQKHRHFILYKPWGYLSQFVYNQTRRKNKKLLGELHSFPEGTMAIGRLDENSEGLLLLTTDGQVSEQIRSKKIEKEYYIELDGEITPEAIEQLMNGVSIRIEGKRYTTLPCQVVRLDPAQNPWAQQPAIRDRHRPGSWLSITLTEGKYRQIRKMSATVGFPTLRLIRIRVGDITLGKLLPGEMMEVDHF